MSGTFLSALRARDVAKAIEPGHKSGNWPALALGAISQLDQAWQDDALCIGDIAETYWTLRHALDALTAVPVRSRAPSLFIGKAVIYILNTEQHTFGPQMLVDQISRVGWDAQLRHGVGFSDLMEHLGSDHVDVLGISIGTDNCLDGLADLILDARRCSINPDIKILIGGSAICAVAGQYAFLKADWVAASAKDALQFFERGWSVEGVGLMGDQPKHLEGQYPWRGYDAAALLAMSSDVSILLSADNVVVDVMVPEKAKFDADLRAKWLGRALMQIVARDSLGKIEPLLGFKTGTPSSADRWRHLNFVVEGAAGIPLLAKHFHVETPYGNIRQVVCRDLRPMTELNARWQNENSRLLEQVARATAKNEVKSFAGDLVGSAPLKDIMDAAVDEVARICIAEALKFCNGDDKAAAQLLGISIAELRRRRGVSLH